MNQKKYTDAIKYIDSFQMKEGKQKSIKKNSHAEGHYNILLKQV